jgi:hypothetical protein
MEDVFRAKEKMTGRHARPTALRVAYLRPAFFATHMHVGRPLVRFGLRRPRRLVAILRRFQLAVPDVRGDSARRREPGPSDCDVRPFAARAPNTLLRIKSLLGHATGHGTLRHLGAHIRRRSPRYLRFGHFSAALLQGQFIRRAIWPGEGWLGRLRAANQQRTRYREQWKPGDRPRLAHKSFPWPPRCRPKCGDRTAERVVANKQFVGLRGIQERGP